MSPGECAPLAPVGARHRIVRTWWREGFNVKWRPQLEKLAGWFPRIILPSFAIWKKVAETHYTYTVLVDDNFHYTDESERYTSGTFPSLEAAIEGCRHIVDGFLEESCKGIEPSRDALYEHYVSFGPDPFIVADDPYLRPVPFSAWTYAREQCFRRFGNPETPESRS